MVKDGKVGNIDLPQAAPGSIVQTPTSVAWMPGSKTGALTFQYLDATKNTGPLEAGANSATIVVANMCMRAETRQTTLDHADIRNADVVWRVDRTAESDDCLFIEGYEQYLDLRTNERVAHPYMGIMEFTGGKISKWRDYFEMNQKAS